MNARAPQLLGLQELFWTLLCEGAVSPDAIPRAFVGTDALPAQRRLDIYINMALFRQVDALRNIVPATARACGDDAFFRLARAYVRAHPSRHPSIGRLASQLPGFLRTEGAQAALAERDRPDLADLCALEVARDASFDAEDVAALEELPLTEGDFARTRLRLNPGLRVVSTQFEVGALWELLHDPTRELPAELPAPCPGAQQLAVWRREFDAVHAVIAADEAAALALATQGAPLAEICGAFGGRDDPASAAFEALGSWLAEGFVCGVE